MQRAFIFCILFIPLLGFSSKIDTIKYTCYFEFNKTNLHEDSIIQLNNWLDEVKVDYLYEGVILKSYADTVGTAEVNLEISNERLESIRLLLENKAMRVLHQQSFGEEMSSGQALDSWRKVEIQLILRNPIRLPILEDQRFITRKKQLYNEKVIEKYNEIQFNESNLINLNILFVGDRDSYLESDNVEIDALFIYLNTNPTFTIDIQGHVCCSNEYRLSRARAYTVYKDLLKRGIAAERMTYEGYGNTKPMVKERDEISKQKNRRVDIIINKN